MQSGLQAHKSSRRLKPSKAHGSDASFSNHTTLTLQSTVKTDDDLHSINLPSHVSQLQQGAQIQTINNQEANLAKVQGVSLWQVILNACFHLSPELPPRQR
jgi:hypothetical protein